MKEFSFPFLSLSDALVKVLERPGERLLGLGRVVDRDEDGARHRREKRRGGKNSDGAFFFLSPLRARRASKVSSKLITTQRKDTR